MKTFLKIKNKKKETPPSLRALRKKLSIKKSEIKGKLV